MRHIKDESRVWPKDPDEFSIGLLRRATRQLNFHHVMFQSVTQLSKKNHRVQGKAAVEEFHRSGLALNGFENR